MMAHHERAPLKKPPEHPQMTRYETARRNTERKLAAISAANQALARDWIDQRTNVDDLKPTTASLKATALWRFDQFLKGRPFDQASDEEFVQYRKSIAARYRTADSQGQYLYHVSNF